MPEDVADLELLSIRQLKQMVSTSPEPARVHVQVDSIQVKETSQSKPYYEVRLTDGVESLLWRVFDGNPAFLDVSKLSRSSWIELAAQWVDTGKYGLDPRQAVIRQLSDEESQALLTGDRETAARQRADYQTILELVHQVNDPRLKRLCLLFLEQQGERFKRAAAAREYHHARRGGLVEHVAQMMRTAVKICDAYPDLNQDLLITGILFHDCGKLWENNYPENGFNMPHTLHGEMLGHIPLGLEVVNKLWRHLMDMPEAATWVAMEPANELVRVHLLHLIGSHHGELQFGSPVLPKTPEAIALHHIDNIDAKMEMFRRVYENSSEIAPGIYERMRPLPGNVIEPLRKFTAENLPE